MELTFNQQVGSRIKEKRKALLLTRESFAEKIEISPQFLAEIELGKKGMSFATLLKICNTLCVSTDYILTGNSNNNVSQVLDILSTLDEENIHRAEEMLKIFVSAVKNCKK